MAHRFLLVACWLACGAFLTACNTYRVNQTSLVPSAILSPPVAFKPGFDGSLTGTYTAGSVGRTEFGKDASLWVSRGTLLTALEYSGRVVGGRLQLFQGFNSGADRVTRNNVGKPSGQVWGFGPGLVFRALGDHPRHRLTFDASTLFVVSPSRVLASCTSCESGEIFDTDESGFFHDRSVAFMISGGFQHRILLSENLRVLWGFNLQSSVINSFELDRSIPGRSKVNMGAPHPTVMAGIEWAASGWATLQPGFAWIAPPSPEIYLPTALLTVRFHDQDDAWDTREPASRTGLRVLDEDARAFLDADLTVSAPRNEL